MEIQNSNKESSFSYTSLEAVRSKLLDLSKINNLISFKFSKASSIRFIECDLERVFGSLLKNEKINLIAIPEPTEKELIDAGIPQDEEGNFLEKVSAEQWAKHLKINTNYDLSGINLADDVKFNKKLQTLFFADDLSALTKKFRQGNSSSVEESGIHVLYLVFGFIEWFDSKDSKDAYHAPLITVPVEFDKLGAKSTITIKDDGSDFLNQTFKEKAEHDFGITLPNFDLDNDETLESYFEKLNTLFIENGLLKWKIKQNLCLTTRINFSKQVMYLDLDPSKWPLNASIEHHDIVQKLFATQSDEPSGGVVDNAKEYLIDTIDEIDDLYPIIYDADSSQHSALIDAIQGCNLVIEGPPGTGKSQTITNLIAACINNNLRVLFVAEKMAALNVVKSRLDNAGLGEYCLELHSHKANKTEVLETLNIALNRKDNRSLNKIDEEIMHAQHYKNQLNNYVEGINALWKNTGLSISEIFSRATRLKYDLQRQYKPLPIDGISGDSFDSLESRKLADRVKTIADVADKIISQAGKNITEHPWYGCINHNSSREVLEDLKQHLIISNNILNEIFAEGKKYSEALHVDLSRLELDLLSFSKFYADLKNFPILNEEDDYHLLFALLNDAKEKSLVNKYVECVSELNNFDGILHEEQLLNLNEIKKNDQLLQKIKETGFSPERKISELVEESHEIKALLILAERISQQLKPLSEALPKDLKSLANGSLLNLHEIKQFSGVISQLPAKLWSLRDPGFLRSSLVEGVTESIPSIDSLIEKYEILSIYFNLDEIPPKNILAEHAAILSGGGIFSFLSSEWRNAKAFFNQYTSSKKVGAKKLKELAPILVEYRSLQAEIEELVENNLLLQKLYKGSKTDTKGILQLVEWYQLIKDTYGSGLGSKYNLAKELHEYLYEDLSDVNEIWTGMIESNYLEFIALNSDLQNKFTAHKDIKDSAIYVNDTNKGYSTLLKGIENSVASFNEILQNFEISMADFENKLKEVVNFNKLIKQLSDSEINKRVLSRYLSNPIDISSFTDENKEAILRYFKIVDYIESLPKEVVAVFKEYCEFEYYSNWKQISAKIVLEDHHEQLINHNKKLDDSIDYSLWMKREDSAYQSLFEKNHSALNNENSLSSWQDFLLIKIKEEETNLAVVLEFIFDNTISPKDLLSLWEYSVYTQIGNEILAEDEMVGSFSGLEQEALKKRFVETDEKLLILQRERIIAKANKKQAPLGINTGTVGNFTESSLIKHEGSKKTRHIPIRSLLSRAQESIQSLKPCFMMSPMSVAQFLEPGKYQFDIVIMDEASQIRPEDAIGAIARGNSAVIVGDPKQLPPTNFFQRTTGTDEDEEDQVTAETTESILDTVIPLFKNRRLRWHYRSRHEKLIEFSNYHFYENDLVVFPSPERSDDLGINYRRVDAGTFIGRQNQEEAKLIVEEVVRLLTKGNSRSIGIVAMNANQSQLIEGLLENRIDSDSYLRGLYNNIQNSEEPIFVKNLENVQGDERDIIIISMTYGPQTEGGKTPQRFGPINSDAGWRRLNVLFTRAKRQMIIFSSMSSRDILADGKKRGVIALRDFLTYCETNSLAGTVTINSERGPDSDFEIAVMTALKERGYQCQPQLGIAGYYLDLAVINPDNPGEYLIGLECDGATYHSAKSARDRDRLRQQVLEGLNWKIERIWSTDWFKYPEREIDRIVRVLEYLRK